MEFRRGPYHPSHSITEWGRERNGCPVPTDAGLGRMPPSQPYYGPASHQVTGHGPPHGTGIGYSQIQLQQQQQRRDIPPSGLVNIQRVMHDDIRTGPQHARADMSQLHSRVDSVHGTSPAAAVAGFGPRRPAHYSSGSDLDVRHHHAHGLGVLGGRPQHVGHPAPTPGQAFGRPFPHDTRAASPLPSQMKASRSREQRRPRHHGPAAVPPHHQTLSATVHNAPRHDAQAREMDDGVFPGHQRASAGEDREQGAGGASAPAPATLEPHEHARAANHHSATGGFVARSSGEGRFDSRAPSFPPRDYDDPAQCERNANVASTATRCSEGAGDDDDDEDFENLLTRYSLLRQTLDAYNRKEKEEASEQNVATNPLSTAADVLETSDRLLNEEIPFPQPPPPVGMSATGTNMAICPASAVSSVIVASLDSVSSSPNGAPCSMDGALRSSALSVSNSSAIPSSRDRSTRSSSSREQSSKTSTKVSKAARTSRKSKKVTAEPQLDKGDCGEVGDGKFKPFRIAGGKKQNPIVIDDEDGDGRVAPKNQQNLESQPVSATHSSECAEVATALHSSPAPMLSACNVPPTPGLASFSGDQPTPSTVSGVTIATCMVTSVPQQASSISLQQASCTSVSHAGSGNITSPCSGFYQNSAPPRHEEVMEICDAVAEVGDPAAAIFPYANAVVGISKDSSVNAVQHAFQSIVDWHVDTSAMANLESATACSGTAAPSSLQPAPVSAVQQEHEHEDSEDEERKLTAMRERLLNSMMKKGTISQPSPPTATAGLSAPEKVSDDAPSPAPPASNSLKWLKPDPIVIVLGKDSSDSDDDDDDVIDDSQPSAVDTRLSSIARVGSGTPPLTQVSTSKPLFSLGPIEAMLKSVRSDVEDKEKKSQAAALGESQDLARSRRLQLLKAKLARLEKEKRERKVSNLKRKAVASRLRREQLDSGRLAPMQHSPGVASSREDSSAPTSSECSPAPQVQDEEVDRTSTSQSSTAEEEGKRSRKEQEHCLTREAAISPAPADDPAIQHYRSNIKCNKMILSRLLVTLMNKEQETSQQATHIQQLEEILEEARASHTKLAGSVARLEEKVDVVRSSIITQETLVNQLAGGEAVKTRGSATSQESTEDSQRGVATHQPSSAGLGSVTSTRPRDTGVSAKSNVASQQSYAEPSSGGEPASRPSNKSAFLKSNATDTAGSGLRQSVPSGHSGSSQVAAESGAKSTSMDGRELRAKKQPSVNDERSKPPASQSRALPPADSESLRRSDAQTPTESGSSAAVAVAPLARSTSSSSTGSAFRPIINTRAQTSAAKDNSTKSPAYADSVKITETSAPMTASCKEQDKLKPGSSKSTLHTGSSTAPERVSTRSASSLTSSRPSAARSDSTSTSANVLSSSTHQQTAGASGQSSHTHKSSGSSKSSASVEAGVKTATVTIACEADSPSTSIATTAGSKSTATSAGATRSGSSRSANSTNHADVPPTAGDVRTKSALATSAAATTTARVTRSAAANSAAKPSSSSSVPSKAESSPRSRTATASNSSSTDSKSPARSKDSPPSAANTNVSDPPRSASSATALNASQQMGPREKQVELQRTRRSSSRSPVPPSTASARQETPASNSTPCTPSSPSHLTTSGDMTRQRNAGTTTASTTTAGTTTRSSSSSTVPADSGRDHERVTREARSPHTPPLQVTLRSDTDGHHRSSSRSRSIQVPDGKDTSQHRSRSPIGKITVSTRNSSSSEQRSISTSPAAHTESDDRSLSIKVSSRSGVARQVTTDGNRRMSHSSHPDSHEKAAVESDGSPSNSSSRKRTRESESNPDAKRLRASPGGCEHQGSSKDKSAFHGTRNDSSSSTRSGSLPGGCANAPAPPMRMHRRRVTYKENPDEVGGTPPSSQPATPNQCDQVEQQQQSDTIAQQAKQALSKTDQTSQSNEPQRQPAAPSRPKAPQQQRQSQQEPAKKTTPLNVAAELPAASKLKTGGNQRPADRPTQLEKGHTRSETKITAIKQHTAVDRRAASSPASSASAAGSPMKTVDRLRNEQLQKEATLSSICAPHSHLATWSSRLLPQSNLPASPVSLRHDITTPVLTSSQSEGREQTNNEAGEVPMSSTPCPGPVLSFQSYASPLTAFRSYQWTPDFHRQFPATTATFQNSIAPQQKLCPYDLHGTCNDSKCPWQHISKVVGPAADVPGHQNARPDCADTAELLLEHPIRPPVSARPPSPAAGHDEEKQQREPVGKALIGESNLLKDTTSKQRTPAPQSSVKQAAAAAVDPLTERYFKTAGSNVSDKISALEKHLESSPKDVDSWLNLETMKHGLARSVSSKDALDTSLHVLTKALEHNRDREDVWVPYLKYYAEWCESDSDLHKVLKQAASICPSYTVLQQCMLLSRTHAVKTEACQTALQTLVSSAAAGVDKATLSQHVLETLLYQTQVDVLVGKQQLACHRLEEKIKLQVQDSVPVLKRGVAGALLSPSDLCVALLTLLYIQYMREMPPALYSPVDAQPSLIVCKDPFVVPWDRVKPSKEQVLEVKALTESYLQFWASSEDVSGDDWQAIFNVHRNLAALYVQVEMFKEASHLASAFRKSSRNTDVSPAWLMLGEVSHIRGYPAEKINKVYSEVQLKHPSISISYQLACLFTDKTPGFIFGAIETGVRKCCFKPEYKSKIASIHRLYLLHYALGLWTPHDLGLEREYLKPLSERDRAYLWLSACLWHSQIEAFGKYDDYLSEFEGHYEFNVDSTFQSALADLHSAEAEKIVWEAYLRHRHKRLSKPDASADDFEAFKVLVLRCMSAVSPLRTVPHSSMKSEWLDYGFHNMVIDLYLSTKATHEQLDVFEQLTTTFPHNVGLTMRAVNHALQQEPLCVDQARRYTASLLALHPTCLDIWKMAIQLELFLKQTKQARWMYQQATKALPLCASIWTEYLLFELAHSPLNKSWIAVQSKAAEFGVNIKIKAT
ncbi:mucin-12-like isoform X2 [Sycon ciliatum]|uniref:mucin-12-like isoform X2 n=1 Tax=Sycon ciliatum TaxID=27933 RepID=UPI0031F669A9